MNFTQDQLAQIISGNPNVAMWYAAITAVIDKYQINTPNRLAGFLAQCAHESAMFTVIRENLNYRAESLLRVFPSHFSSIEEAQQYEHQQDKIANRIYANRMGNGPEESGDGWAFSGRGLIQLTGKDNYSRFASSIGMTLADTIQHLTTFEGAADSAGWFWATHNLNETCDNDDIETMTRRINGGTIGLNERAQLYALAKQILGA